MRVLTIVGLAVSVSLCFGCSKDETKKAPATPAVKQPAAAKAKPTPVKPAPVKAVPKPAANPDDAKPPKCGDGETAVSTADRRACKADSDCTMSCEYGALNKKWYGYLGSGCKDGCEGPPDRSVACKDGTCQAFFDKDGKRDDGCSDAKAPAFHCVPKDK